MIIRQQQDVPPNSNRVWLITGASSDAGRAMAETVLARGERATVTAREPERLLGFIERYPAQAVVLELDVTRPDQAQNVAAQTVERFGGIDVLVNSAGVGLIGAVEELDASQLRQQFETNVFGFINVSKSVLPIMRRARHGHIITVSAVGGLRTAPGFGAYNATTFAVEGIFEALAQEVGSLGIKVTIVESMTSLNGQREGDPLKAAEAIITAVDADRPPLQLALGADALAKDETLSAALQPSETQIPSGG